MPVRSSFAAIGDVIGSLPGPMKILGAFITVAPVLWALFGIGWTGVKTPGQNDRHFAQMDTMRTEQRARGDEQASRDTIIWTALREGNRLLRCNLTESSDLARARCAARREDR